MSRRLALLIALAVMVAAAPSASGSGTLRLGAGHFEPSGEATGARQTRYSIGVLEIFTVDTRYSLRAEGSVPLFAAYELPVGAALGLELAVERVASDLDLRALHDVVVTVGETGEEIARFTRDSGYRGEMVSYPVTAGLYYHPLGDRRLDLYLGPLVGYLFTGDAELDTPSGRRSVAMEDDALLGATVGFDLPVGHGGWLLTAALRYLQAESRPASVPHVFPVKFVSIDDEDPSALGLDPLVVRIGLGRRFGGS